MTDKFINPITMSFKLLERYKTLLRSTLHVQGLHPGEVDEILQSIQVDRGLSLTLNRRYKTGQASLRQFCINQSLADSIPDRFPRLASKRLYAHQERAIESILAGRTTIVSTGTGSGKTEAFLIPILDHCLKHPGPGVKALIIYPMNALANDQVRRLEEATAVSPMVTFGLFTGSTDEHDRNAIRREPPDILITNYVMLDWMLTRSKDQPIFEASRDMLKYIVLDEIHTYRGNKATHLKYLLVRLKSRLSGQIVQIGTSATLQTKGQIEGYLVDDETRRDAFIKPLLDVETYTFVDPEYELEPHIGFDNRPFPLPDETENLGWALEVDPEQGIENLGRLTGKTYPLIELQGASSISQTQFFRDLQQHPFIQEMRNLLTEHGAQSFVELISLLTGLVPPSYPTHNIEEFCKAYLSAVAFVNHHAGENDQPLLDFRVHLFLRDIGGYLKRCVKCQKYHSGNQEFCQDCGFPLFCVYRHDIQQCVGKVSGNRLKWELRPESDDKRNSYYVLVSSVGRETVGRENDTLNFREDVRQRGDEIILDYDAYGRLRLRLLPIRCYKEILQKVIPLIDGTRRHQYLHNLVKSVLDFQPHGQKKLLGFIDNRERASQYASVLQDEFASQFLEEYLKLCLQDSKEVDLLAAHGILHRQIPDPEDSSATEQALVDELDLWYWRYVSRPPRRFESKKDLLRLKSDEGLTEFERDLLDIFVTERAIAKTYQDDKPDSRYIRFEKHYATDRKGIHCAAEERSDDPRYPSISLGENAREYQEFVSKHGHERICHTIEELVKRDVLCTGSTSDGKTHFYINPRWVCLNVPASDYDDYDDVREQFLLTSAVHSSEIKDYERQEVEATFQTGSLNFVMATPTLEMGIDIGKLQNVLMVGVPPLPSNYAQRAGRAGRGRNDQFALIVTFCSEYDEHDSYYFHRPKLMINGVISPPTFDPFTPEIVQKHINAFMLAGHVDGDQTLARFCTDIDTEIQRKAAIVKEVFGAEICTEAYLLGDFKARVLTEATVPKQASGSPQQRFYASGFFPDYLFRRDQVYVVDAETVVGGKMRESLLADIALSEREPELAYYKFVPGETVFIAGDVYDITSEGRYRVISIDDEAKARHYRYLTAVRQVRYAVKRKVLKKYDRDRVFANDQPFLGKRQVLGIAFHPECCLLFVNRGRLDYESTEAFVDKRGRRFNIGYEVRRQAIVLRFDSLVCADEELPLSFVSALDRTIKDEYGLDESEIRLLVDARPHPPDPKDRPRLYIVLYDANGNGNVPMREIFDNFDRIVEIAHHNMQTCPGSGGQPCGTGCYLCLKSYATRWFASNVDKQTALMFTGYLLGENRFRPSIAEPEQTVTEFDLELRLERHGNVFIVRSPHRTYSDTLNGDQNKVIFDLLTQAIQSEFSDTMQSLKVVAREPYIVDAINNGAIRKNKDDFARLQFNLLRFKTVKAEKERA